MESCLYYHITMYLSIPFQKIVDIFVMHFGDVSNTNLVFVFSLPIQK